MQLINIIAINIVSSFLLVKNTLNQLIFIGAPCLKGPCHNGGTCTEDARGDFKCTCKAGFTGQYCDSQLGVRLCEQSPCRNDGICIALSDNEYECECRPGWTGKNCETNIDECASFPCKNSGICTDGINNYTCRCDKTG